MTLDEAIRHAEEVAEYDCYNDEQKKCADEHRQLAEWLRELKRLRESATDTDTISRRKGVMMRSALKRLTEEDRFARAFCCWANNHKGWSKTKKRNRRIARRKLKRGEWEGSE